ncbi:MAG TPA: 1,2-phenylacetyl-CoA epoxidase subunit PaaC [bacterium]|jgi:ring-1,2-phenylacetyl-CoA epoxidase subunit PaaC
MEENLDNKTRDALFEYCLRIGDDLLVLGHRLSEWCGHAPILEEDIALANIALDCIGQAEAYLKLAGEIEGAGRDEDALAYFRDEYEFKNIQLVEQPNGDFAVTIARQFLYDAYAVNFFDDLSKCAYKPLADIASKSLVETKYHLRHSSQWTLRLGDGTEESHDRIQNAVDKLWMFTGELFFMNDLDKFLVEKGYAPDIESIRTKWNKIVKDTFARATLNMPSDETYMATGAREGRHSEQLGHMLSEMQITARSHPGAKW